MRSTILLFLLLLTCTSLQATEFPLLKSQEQSPLASYTY